MSALSQEMLSENTQTEINLSQSDQNIALYDLNKLSEITGKSIKRLPYSIRILVENLLRNLDGYIVKPEDVIAALDWAPKDNHRAEIPYMPARVVMQDFTGVPAVVDLAAMRDAFEKAGGDPTQINPLVDTALVIDHSVQVDFFGDESSLNKNVALEFQRNKERYSLLKWGQTSLDGFKVVPPGMGIIHQVNLEHLAQVVWLKEKDGKNWVYPDTLVGTDSHTTMVNGIGVMGWGVGGIEAEAVMLGQPIYMRLPDVVGVKLTGELREGVTATDLVLRITEVLRQQGVVGKFVEYFGEGLKNLTLPNRATIANMAPEYGATMGFFPSDAETVNYLKQSGRGEIAERVEAALKAFCLYHDEDAVDPEYTDIVEIDLSTIDSTLAGPKRPQDRVPLRDLKNSFAESLKTEPSQRGFGLSDSDLNKSIEVAGLGEKITHGSVVIAAITSCTNTSNPYVMVGAGLLAKNAVEKGLSVKPFVKTSLAPGSQVVTAYLKAAGLLEYLEKLRFNVVGYGCTTCIGNSGPLDQPVVDAINQGDLVAASVLSGNRNFEGRVSPHVKANYLASPLHVVAYALMGSVNFDPDQDIIGLDQSGKPVYLKDIWPSNADIQNTVESIITPEMYADKYASVYEGTEDWKVLDAPESVLYGFKKSSTYIQCPPFFEGFENVSVKPDVIDASVLALLGDSVTTDHISPAGVIPEDYPAGQYLKSRGVDVKDFNSYGSRRGNHEVMMRGTFANVRLRNLLVPGIEGGFTKYHPTQETMYIYDAAEQYQNSNTPLIIIAGKEYGTGSSRDWAAKGTSLLGVKIVIAESYERIHRSNLIGMGVLPLQFMDGEGQESLGLDGSELYTIRGLSEVGVGSILEAQARTDSGELKIFKAKARVDTEVEVDYYNNGGILQTVLKNRLIAQKNK